MATEAAAGGENASAELMRALTELVHRASEHGDLWHSPERLKAIAEFISAVAWPTLAVLALLLFYGEIGSMLRSVTEFEFLGLKAKIARKVETELDKSAEAASHMTGKSSAATEDEKRRAEAVAELTQADMSLVARQVDALAAEYENIRATMPPGDDRTRRMEVVVAKMRTLGRAANPLRHELAASPSPGKRLQAIATMQVLPDYDMLDWLAERAGTEKPFVGYHALVALNAAASAQAARANADALRHALTIAEGQRGRFGEDTDRHQMLDQFKARVEAL